MTSWSLILTTVLALSFTRFSHGFVAPLGGVTSSTPRTSEATVSRQEVIAAATRLQPLYLSDKKAQDKNEGVVELADDDDEKPTPAAAAPAEVQNNPVAPFLSQGDELAEGVLNPDLSDPKQTRVIIYIILSLLPVLFLIPLMLGSRDLIPLDALPPVDM